MSISYLLRVFSDGRELQRGTAWFVRNDLVVTAFHVVSDDGGEWLADDYPNVQHQLELSPEKTAMLEPVVSDTRTDIALLRPIEPIADMTVLSLAANEAVELGANWNTLGYPQFHQGAFGIGGSITTVHTGTSATTLQLLFNQGTTAKWEGISGSPVQIDEQVAGIVTQVTYGTNTGWAAPVSELRLLLRFTESSKFIKELSTLLMAVYESLNDIAHLAELFHLGIPRDITLDDFAKELTQRAWRKGPDTFNQLLIAVVADHPASPETSSLKTKLDAYISPVTIVTARTSQTEIVRAILQELARDELPGVALLEPLNFGARRIVDEVATKLKQASRRELPVRLVPKPNTADERRLYSALCRDLHRGLELERGQPLPDDCLKCFSPSRSSYQRPTAGTDPCSTMDEEGFELLLTRLLEGPIISDELCLILIVEGLSRVTENHLQNWAWLMSRLTSQFPLKLLIWGSQELHELCSGAKNVAGFSPFQRLKQIPLSSLSADETNKLVTSQLGQPVGKHALYDLTSGHPALVTELLERASIELRESNASGLRNRVLASSHLKRIKNLVGRDDEAIDVLQRMLRGDREKRFEDAEERLYWLGILQEDGPDAWQWAAPILEDWAKQWLG